MIENVKRFVNGHRTLMAIVVCVLAICFLCWCLCCKDRPSANKTKGGETCSRVVRARNNEGGFDIMKVIGAKIVGPAFMYTTSDYADLYMAEHDLIKSYKLFYNRFLCDGDDMTFGGCSLKNIVKSPIAFICGLATYKPSLLLCSKKDTFFDDVYDEAEKGLKNYSSTSSSIEFNFRSYLDDYQHKFVNKDGEEEVEEIKVSDVYEYYKEFVQFVDGVMKKFVHKVVFLGQPAKKLDKESFFPLSSISGAVPPNMIRYDKSSRGELTSELYDELKKVVREWYNDDDIKMRIQRLYCSEDCDIRRASEGLETEEYNNRRDRVFDDVNQKSKWQIADIYPAYKMLKMVFLLLAFSTKYEGSEIEYMKMVASYIAYVQLFNSFCAAKMWGSWNGSISNSYVYEYVNDNVQQGDEEETMEPNIGKISELSGQAAVKTGVPKGYLRHFFKGAIDAANPQQNKIIRYEASIQDFKNENLRTDDNGKKYDLLLSFAERYVKILNFLLDFTDLFEFVSNIESDIDSCNILWEAVRKKTNGLSVKKIKSVWEALSRAYEVKYSFLVKLKTKFDASLVKIRKVLGRYGLAVDSAILSFKSCSLGYDSQDHKNIFDRKIEEMGFYLEKTVSLIGKIVGDNSVCEEIKYPEEINGVEWKEFVKKRDLLLTPYSVLNPSMFVKWIEDDGKECYDYRCSPDAKSRILGKGLTFLDSEWSCVYFISSLIEKMGNEKGDFGFYVLYYLSNLLGKICLNGGSETEKEKIDDFISGTELDYDHYLAGGMLRFVQILSIFDSNEVDIDEEKKIALIGVAVVKEPVVNEFEWFRGIQEKIKSFTDAGLGDRQFDASLPLNSDYRLVSAVIQILKENCHVNGKLLLVYIGILLIEYYSGLFETNSEIVDPGNGDLQKLELGFESTKMLEVWRKIHVYLLDFVDEESEAEEKFQNLTQLFSGQKTFEKKSDIIIILHMINDISMYKFRNVNFWSKFERVLLICKEVIKGSLDNTEIFGIFKYNKRLLSFLFKEEFIIMDQDIYLWLICRDDNTNHLDDYFGPELNTFVGGVRGPGDDFNQKRELGENDSYICSLIRRDNVDEFIAYVKKNEIDLKSSVPQSLFETNELLLVGEVSLIQYAAFFGSSLIFRYLSLNGVEVVPDSLIKFVVHGDNPDIKSELIEGGLGKNVEVVLEAMKMSIKCHSNDAFNWLFNEFEEDIYGGESGERRKRELSEWKLRYHNFTLMDNDMILNPKTQLFILNEFHYYLFIDELLKTKKIDIDDELLHLMVYIVKPEKNQDQWKPEDLFLHMYPPPSYTFAWSPNYGEHPLYFLSGYSVALPELEPLLDEMTDEEFINRIVEVKRKSGVYPSRDDINSLSHAFLSLSEGGRRDAKRKLKNTSEGMDENGTALVMYDALMNLHALW